MRLTESMLDNLYNEMLDDCYPELEIAGYKFLTSRALKRLDIVAYREGFNCWLDMQFRDGFLYEYSDGEIHDCPESDEESEIAEPTYLSVFKQALDIKAQLRD